MPSGMVFHSGRVTSREDEELIRSNWKKLRMMYKDAAPIWPRTAEEVAKLKLEMGDEVTSNTQVVTDDPTSSHYAA